MRESCTSGSVRGARGNSRPYRNDAVCCTVELAPGTLRRIAAMHKFGSYRRYRRTCHELVGPIRPTRPTSDIGGIEIPQCSDLLPLLRCAILP